MLDSEWLDIAIGVVFVWFLLAITVSAINESLTRLLAMRSKQLWKALRQMIDGDEKPKSLIQNAFGLLFWRRRPGEPASSPTVTDALYGTKTVQALETRTSTNLKTRISYLPTKLFSQALMEMADSPGDEPQQAITNYIEGLPAATPFKAQLAALWRGANHDVKEFGVQAEAWFDGQMTRLSAIYKSQVRITLAIIGIAVAIVGFSLGLRSDALALVSDLQHDANLRNIVVATASDAAKEDLAKAGCPDQTPKDGTEKLDCQLKGAAKLKDINIVIHTNDPRASAGNWSRLWYPFTHVSAGLGVLITGVAISFGSTFWFDLLRRLVGIRGAVKTTD